MTEQEKKLEKVRKSCATTKKILGVFRVLFLVGIVLCIVGGCLCIVMHEKVDDIILKATEQETVKIKLETLSMGNGLLDLDIKTREIMQEGNYAVLGATYCFYGAVVLVFGFIIFSLLYKIFESIESSQSPFDEELLKKLRRIFIIITVVTVWLIGVGIAVVLGLSFWCIYQILDYGIALQTEVDETL